MSVVESIISPGHEEDRMKTEALQREVSSVASGIQSLVHGTEDSAYLHNPPVLSRFFCTLHG